MEMGHDDGLYQLQALTEGGCGEAGDGTGHEEVCNLPQG